MLWFFATLFFVPGAIMLAIATSHLVQAYRSKAWPKVEALISRSAIEESHSEGTSYRPAIRFTYTVAGECHHSDRIQIGWPLSAGKTWAANTVARYPAGSKILAAVHPQKPALCILEPGVHPLHFGCIAFFSGFVTIGVVAALIAVGVLPFK